MKRINIQGTQIIDLSQTIAPDIPVPVGFPMPRLETFLSQESGDIVNVEILTMGLHAGTHVDAPYHFFSKGSSVDQLPVEIRGEQSSRSNRGDRAAGERGLPAGQFALVRQGAVHAPRVSDGDVGQLRGEGVSKDHLSGRGGPPVAH